MGGFLAGNRLRYGIMGGTFNPIHFGHLVTAEEAQAQFHLDQVIFMPTGWPPHKEDQEVLPAEERYLMTVIATASNPRFTVSRHEIDEMGPSYTINTLQAMRDRHGAGVDLYFITGADAILEILTWKEPHVLAEYCSFIAATRPGYELDRFEETRAQLELEGHRYPEVHLMAVPALAISSTDIRRRIAEDRPIRYLLPEAVLNFIVKSRFYQRTDAPG